ncbi:BrnT family toxin [Candidatus Amarolinea dominans]|uniref:BrnT family toxin n=1 Tax=Candidatus Amarolinea dominans TaxID=3140696 RepID=UPI001D4F5513|nr:BrnT family toxin [Anaerolineae bacterium]MBK9091612.1 BrnT family toxin [Anaerolineae bacterium]MBK9230303.1 BrnT family toxin [Anaerolineae bacterium]
MQIIDILWLPDIVEKLASKHGIESAEVEELFAGRPQFRRIQRGKIHGEDLYSTMGRTGSGRYVIVYFIRKSSGTALVISARDMDSGERKQYGRK